MPDERAYGLVVRKVAGEDGLAREYRYDVNTGERYLASPVDGRPLPRPLVGVEWSFQHAPYDEPPKRIQVPYRYASSEPWIERTGQEVVHQAGGNAEDPWKVTHTFVHCDELVLHLLSGDYVYRVTHNPGKYDDETGDLCGPDRAGDPTTHVDHFYEAELVSSGSAASEV